MKTLRKDEFMKLHKEISNKLPDFKTLEILESQHQQNPSDVIKTVREAMTFYELSYFQLRDFASQCGELSLGRDDIEKFDDLMKLITLVYPQITSLYVKLQNKYVSNKGFSSLCEKAGWNLIEVVCGECESPMEVSAGLENLSVYYLCQKEGCNNRMSVEIFEKIYSKIIDEMAKNPDTDLTGLKWESKTRFQYYKFEVFKFKPNKVTVKVRNIYRNGM